MARTNKYTSLNFNHIYANKTTTTTTNHHHRSPSSNKTLVSNSRIHGNMLVLTLPCPKPLLPPPQPSPKPDPPSIDPESVISLRPLGRTGAGLVNMNMNVNPLLPVSDKFVPPHLRPGFHGKEEKPEPEVQKMFRSPIREQGRPKSGGGYDYEMNRRRPGSSGSNRPYSSG